MNSYSLRLYLFTNIYFVGFVGECGVRSGYVELTNMDAEVVKMLIKSVSAKACPNVIGQVRLYCV